MNCTPDLIGRQRPGGKPDNSDLKKGTPGFNLFGKKPAKPETPEPPQEKKTNWWTLK
jgi:hypothetical protein